MTLNEKLLQVKALDHLIWNGWLMIDVIWNTLHTTFNIASSNSCFFDDVSVPKQILVGSLKNAFWTIPVGEQEAFKCDKERGLEEEYVSLSSEKWKVQNPWSHLRVPFQDESVHACRPEELHKGWVGWAFLHGVERSSPSTFFSFLDFFLQFCCKVSFSLWSRRGSP